MIDIQAQRKIRIHLADYDYQKDIENRLVMARFSHMDVAVLQEIIYSPLKLSLSRLADDLSLSHADVREVLLKFSQIGLLTLEEDIVLVDKEMRKYYEAQVMKFEEDFKPGMEFLLSLIRKVPFHVLPLWYAIPRSSNNMMESIIEKYLHTPSIFHRYLQEFYTYYPHLAPLVRDLYNSPHLKLRAPDILKEYAFTREQFEEVMLLIEFSMIACLRYEKEGEGWQEIITPFEEWREYLTFLRTTQAESIQEDDDLHCFRLEEFAFVRDMAQILRAAKCHSLPVSMIDDAWLKPKTAEQKEMARGIHLGFAHRLLKKIELLKLAEVGEDGHLLMTEIGKEWLTLSDEEQALYLYRHPHNALISPILREEHPIDRTIREAEKSIQRVLHAGWVYFDDFIEGTLVGFTDEQSIYLKKMGRAWKYTLPLYTREQVMIIKATVLEWLFEIGAVSIGQHLGKECFKVTHFGQLLFGR